MYESLVIGRSFMMNRVMFFLKNIFCRSCLQSGRAWTTHFSNTETRHVLRGSIDRLVHFGIYKGGDHSEILTDTQGDYGQWNVQQRKRTSWSTLCPWCQRGRVIWCYCHQVQRGRLLALWCMCCTWWQPSHRRISHLCITRWIFRRDVRCD